MYNFINFKVKQYLYKLERALYELTVKCYIKLKLRESPGSVLDSIIILNTNYEHNEQT